MKTTTDRVSLTDLRDQLRTYKESVLANLVMAGEIPAPTFSEHRRIEFLINRFIESSVSEVSVDDAGNGIGIIKGTGGEQGNGRAILINAHADTVFSEKTDHTLMVGKETISGPGVADNGLGFAVLATLPQILSELDIRFHNDMILLGGVKSLGRGNLDGIRFFLDQSPFDIVAGLCIEGIQLGRLSYQSIGMFRGEITCRVPESYDWSRFGEASAVLTLNEIINKINATPTDGSSPISYYPNCADCIDGTTTTYTISGCTNLNVLVADLGPGAFAPGDIFNMTFTGATPNGCYRIVNKIVASPTDSGSPLLFYVNCAACEATLVTPTPTTTSTPTPQV
ncbi:MAG: hypothetical protein EBR93_01950, partial [Bacteroidetes bacterium]|nr:hypothetical protein [Bacteroidota bacterium]